jgi:hypothetical protein
LLELRHPGESPLVSGENGFCSLKHPHTIARRNFYLQIQRYRFVAPAKAEVQ